MTASLLVFLGAGLGGVLRHGVNLVAVRLGSGFPWGTLAINVLGSLLMGIVAGYFARRGGAMQAQLFLATGVLGGFTTFSTFSLDAYMLLVRGEIGPAFGYVAGSVAAGLGGLVLGLMLTRQIL